MDYPVIDMKRTGMKIKHLCRERGISVRDIKEFMNFSSSQSVYDWFHGKSMPSLDNFYALSRLLHVPMENLICASDQMKRERWIILFKTDSERYRLFQKKRLSVYKSKMAAWGTDHMFAES